MQVQVNGKPFTASREGLTLTELLPELGLSPEKAGIALALNWAVVPRSAWSSTVVQAGDSLEIIAARQGG